MCGAHVAAGEQELLCSHLFATRYVTLIASKGLTVARGTTTASALAVIPGGTGRTVTTGL
jgi:hypothetical protein